MTQAVREFADIVNRVHYGREKVLLTRGKKPVASLIPFSQPHRMTCLDLLAVLNALPVLSAKNASAFARDLKKSKSAIKTTKNPWAIS